MFPTPGEKVEVSDDRRNGRKEKTIVNGLKR